MYTEGQKVRIRMIAMESSFIATEEGVEPKLEKYDIGEGIILGVVPDSDLCEPDEESGKLYWVAVSSGRFDAHRNDLGKLAVWDYELEPLSETPRNPSTS